MNRVLLNSSTKIITDILDSLSGNEMKLLLVMARYSNDNIVDMSVNEKKILDACKISYKTFTKQRAVLVKNQILVVTKISKVYFIDPSFLLAGYHTHIYKNAEAIEKGIKYWKEEAADRKAHRDRAIEAEKDDSNLENYFNRKRDAQNKMSVDEIYETVEKEDIGDIDDVFIGSK